MPHPTILQPTCPRPLSSVLGVGALIVKTADGSFAALIINLRAGCFTSTLDLPICHSAGVFEVLLLAANRSLCWGPVQSVTSKYTKNWRPLL